MIIIRITLLLVILAFVIHCTYDGSANFSGGIIKIGLPPENVEFKPELQNPDIKLQANKMIISKKYINKFYLAEFEPTCDYASGILVCKKYTFYENTGFKKKKLGHFEILQRRNQKEIQNLIDNSSSSGNNGDVYFEIGLKDYFEVSFLSQENNSILIVYRKDDQLIETISRKLSSQYADLSYNITILVGTYEKSDKYTEKRHLFPYYITVDLPLEIR
jgi:hypothetical protein